MPDATNEILRKQLQDRRARLESAIPQSGRQAAPLTELLEEVDAALERMDEGTYGLCETCHDTVERDRLLVDPLLRYCLDHLTPAQRTALEQDLSIAASLQQGLLPEPQVRHAGWDIFYHYKPLGAVSGDYCDLVLRDSPADGLYFFVGDASGKGVSAAIVMAQVRAIFRTLVATGLPVDRLVEEAGRIFSSTTLAAHFATLACGHATASGEIDTCNAGHCPPLVLKNGSVTRIEATGVPLGLFREGRYGTEKLTLRPGETLLLYTDGLLEARNRAEEEFGGTRLASWAGKNAALEPQALVRSCLDHLEKFLDGAPLTDDLTVMAIRRMS